MRHTCTHLRKTLLHLARTLAHILKPITPDARAGNGPRECSLAMHPEITFFIFISDLRAAVAAATAVVLRRGRCFFLRVRACGVCAFAPRLHAVARAGPRALVRSLKIETCIRVHEHRTQRAHTLAYTRARKRCTHARRTRTHIKCARARSLSAFSASAPSVQRPASFNNIIIGTVLWAQPHNTLGASVALRPSRFISSSYSSSSTRRLCRSSSTV